MKQSSLSKKYKAKISASAIVTLFILSSLIVFIIIVPENVKSTSADTYVDDDAAAAWYDEFHVKTIQEGIDNVSVGGTVHVWGGTYYAEGVYLNESVSIIGNGTAMTHVEWIDTTPVDDEIILNADNITISNIHFNNSEAFSHVISNTEDIGNYTHIHHCLFTNAYTAVSISPDTINLYHINVSDTEFYNLSGFAIEIIDSIYVVCCNNTIELINGGISLGWGYNYTIAYNNIMYSNEQAHIGLDHVTNATIYNNTMQYGNWTAIYLDSGANNCTIHSNVIIGFNESSCYGIESYNVLTKDNLFYNNYLSNIWNAYDEGVNRWNTSKTLGANIIGGPYLGGNYWSDYTGVDMTGDGLGDTLVPYNCSGNITAGGDYLPLADGNMPPSLSSPVPVNESIGVSQALANVHVTMNDSDGDLMGWSIECSNGDTQAGAGAANGTMTCALPTALAYGTLYYWWVNVTDGTWWTNETYHFTTAVIPNAKPVISGASPVNGSTGQSLHPQLAVTINDTDGDLMNITFSTNATGVWGPIGTNASVANGTYRWTNSSMDDYLTKYWWYVSVHDGMGGWDTDTYHFTTAVIPNANPVISGVSPVNGSTGQSLHPQLAVTINDTDGDLMNITFSTNATGVWGPIGTNASVANGTYRWTNSSMDDYLTKYWWNVSVNDGMGGWDNDTYHFTTASTIVIPPGGDNSGGTVFGTLRLTLRGESADIKIYRGTVLLYVKNNMVKDTSHNWTSLFPGTYKIRAEGITSGIIKEQTVAVTTGQTMEITVDMKPASTPGFEIVAFIGAIGTIMLLRYKKCKKE